MSTKLKLNAKENPKREGCAAAQRFNLYRRIRTAEGYIKACVKAGWTEANAKRDLAWDSERGFITLG